MNGCINDHLLWCLCRALSGLCTLELPIELKYNYAFYMHIYPPCFCLYIAYLSPFNILMSLLSKTYNFTVTAKMSLFYWFEELAI